MPAQAAAAEGGSVLARTCCLLKSAGRPARCCLLQIDKNVEREIINHRMLSGHPNIVRFREVRRSGSGSSSGGSNQLGAQPARPALAAAWPQCPAHNVWHGLDCTLCKPPQHPAMRTALPAATHLPARSTTG